MRRGLARAVLLLAALPLAGCAVRLGPGPPAPWPAPDEVRLSLLAVGDTGRPLRLSRHFHRQHAVGRGLAVEDRRQPADALLLLGDNFYPQGLRRAELVERLRENVVSPFCHFLELEGPDSPAVARACREEPGRRHPVPLFVLFGNHDHGTPESPELQRRDVATFVSNWRVAEAPVQLVEFGEGLSLLLADSIGLADAGDPAPLVDALRRARGPWRVLAAHHPLVTRRRPAVQPGSFGALVARAVAEAGVPLHAALAGHEHNLQLLVPGPPEVALQVIAGSGSRVRGTGKGARSLYARARPGFARLDLVGRGEEERLVVSLFETGEVPLLEWWPPRLAARLSVDAVGRLHPDPELPGATAAALAP
jgi:hypothetical protein